MRAMVLGGILIIAFGNSIPLLVDDFTTRHAIQIIGLGTAIVLGGIAMALADIAAAIRQRIVWDDLKEQKRNRGAARRG